ncbi:MAG: tripartite tricarboxylate transporter TctB family protein [Spirochaetaceae bacterium]|jgi:putative tricarboxylic transport membrane protein|nr:tripartite tricarboxylate transporter TctB family protein [Spirochaetaceae bacterium]
MKKANIIAAITGMAVSSVMFIITLGFKKFRNVPVGPEFFPRWLAVGLFICSAVLLVQALKIKPADDPGAPTLSFFDRGMQRLLAGAGIIVIYAVSWNFLGFIIATPLAIFALMFLLGLRRYRVMVIFSLGAVIVIFCAFRYFLGIDMPMGFLGGII